MSSDPSKQADSRQSSDFLSALKTIGLNADGIAGVAQVAASIPLSANISFSGGYPVYILAALYPFLMAGYQLLSKKNKFPDALNHFVGLASGSYVLVYWTSYGSTLASYVLEGAIVVVGLGAVRELYGDIKKFYQRHFAAIFCIVLLACLLTPLFQFRNAFAPQGQPPVKLSPSQTQVALDRGQNKTQQATVSANADSSNFAVTARTPGVNNTLVVYLNNTIGGPVVIKKLTIGQQYPVAVRIYAPLSMINGTYDAVLNFSYQDAFLKQYSDSQIISVIVGTVQGQASIPVPLFGLGVAVLVVVVAMAILLNRRNRMKSQIPAPTY